MNLCIGICTITSKKSNWKNCYVSFRRKTVHFKTLHIKNDICSKYDRKLVIITADEVRYLIKFFLASAYKKRKDKKRMIFSQKIFFFNIK